MVPGSAGQDLTRLRPGSAVRSRARLQVARRASQESAGVRVLPEAGYGLKAH